MKKIISAILVCMLLMASVFSLASCSAVSKTYANRINKAAENDEHFTYDEVMSTLGDEAVDLTISAIGVHAGAIIAVKGCTSWDEIEDLIDEGKTVKGIIITIGYNKATKAEYREISTSDKK